MLSEPWEISVGELTDGCTSKQKYPLLSLSSCLSSSVHFLMFEKWPEPSSNHGAPLHHYKVSGGAGPNVQPGVQKSLPVQTSSAAPEEGKRSADEQSSLCLFLCLSFKVRPLQTLAHWKHAVRHNVDNLHMSPQLEFTGVEHIHGAF